ncbi:MAG TPA: hypothetical protein VMV45_05665 [Casimicrobiaceae bacterium]|nr:hypothetical protein [Casimicrobiaceae bacterium]
MTEPLSHGAGSPLDPRMHDEHLAALKDVLGHPFTHASIRQWTQVSLERRLAFKDFFWGCIRWPRSIGRSKGASLADGFALSVAYRTDEYADGGGGSLATKEGWHDLPAPLLWDAQDDAEHYRVNFAGTYAEYNLYINANRLEVKIAGAWTHPYPLPRFLLPQPLGYWFGSFDGSPIVLDDITVEQHLIEGLHPWAVKM